MFIAWTKALEEVEVHVGLEMSSEVDRPLVEAMKNNGVYKVKIAFQNKDDMS